MGHRRREGCLQEAHEAVKLIPRWASVKLSEGEGVA